MTACHDSLTTAPSRESKTQMPKAETSNPFGGPASAAGRYRPNWVAALICLVAAAFIGLSLLDYAPAQVGLPFRSTAATARNMMGWLGADTVWVLLFAIGVSTWLLPVFLGWMLYVSVKNAKHLTGARAGAMGVACLAFAVLSAMFAEATWASDYFPYGYGGLLGRLIYHQLLSEALGPFGSALVAGSIYVVALLVIFLRDIGAELERLFAGFMAWRAERAELKREQLSLRRAEREAAVKQKAAAAPKPEQPAKAPAAAPKPTPTPPKPVEKVTIRGLPPAPESAEPNANPKPEVRVAAPQKPGTALRLARDRTAPGGAEEQTKEPALGPRVELNIVKPQEPKKAAKVSLPQSDDANYTFPPLSLLKEQARPSVGNSEEEHRQNAENLLRILREFGVEVTLGEIHVGPVITRYEVVPAAGVRVEKIAGLDKNIALGMRAQSVRILAPIPGKAAVGVEVPNQNPTPVGMREVLESEDWAGVKSEIPIALGKDVSGKPLVSDLAKMPHLLIAGATGSGKSVCINSIVASILYSKSPKDLRLIMVDPKVVELKIFNTLPHITSPPHILYNRHPVRKSIVDRA